MIQHITVLIMNLQIMHSWDGGRGGSLSHKKGKGGAKFQEACHDLWAFQRNTGLSRRIRRCSSFEL